MLNVSQALKDAFNPNGGKGPREIDYRFVYGIANEEALGIMVPSASYENQTVSRLYQTTVREEETHFVTFENQGWPLGAGWKIAPKYNESARNMHIGYVSRLISDENGLYGVTSEYISFAQDAWPLDGTRNVPPNSGETPQATVYPTYIADFSGDEEGVILPFDDEDDHFYDPYEPGEPIDLLALTIDFGDTVMSDFHVVFYDKSFTDEDRQVVYQVDVTGNTDSVFELQQNVDGVKSVEVVGVRSLLPYKSFRVVYLYPGAVFEFAKSNTSEITVDLACDLLQERAAGGALTVECPNFHGEYNIMDPRGIFRYFKEYQRIIGYVGARKDDGVFGYMPFGDWYVSSVSQKNNFRTLVFEAVDALGRTIDQGTGDIPLLVPGATAPSSVDVNVLSAMATLATAADVIVDYPRAQDNVALHWFPVKETTLSQLIVFLSQATNTVCRAARDSKNGIEFIPVPDTAVTDEFLDGTDYSMEDGIAVEDDAADGYVEMPLNTYSVATSETLLISADLGYVATTDEPYGALLGVYYFLDNFLAVYGIYADADFEDLLYKKLIYTPYDSSYVYQRVEASGSDPVHPDLPTHVDVYGRQITFTQTAAPASIGGSAGTQVQLPTNWMLTPSQAYSLVSRQYKRRTKSTKMLTINYRGYPYIELLDVIQADIPGIGMSGRFYVTELKYTLSGGGMTGSIIAKEV